MMPLTNINLFQIPDSTLEEIRYKFFEYASAFEKPNDKSYNTHVQLKKYHTEKVCSEITRIAKSLEMPKESVNFAEALAWFHDIGRFEQFDKYRTFSDVQSENHAEIAVRIIKKLGFLDEFTSEQKDLLCASILNHNIPRVPPGMPTDLDFFSRLLRDADKIDIWRINIEMNIFNTINTEKQADHYLVPDKLLSRMRNRQIIFIDEVDEFYDSFLFRISWLYDINFLPSFKIIKERRIIPKLFSRLPGSSDLDDLQNLVIQHLEEFIVSPPIHRK